MSRYQKVGLVKNSNLMTISGSNRISMLEDEIKRLTLILQETGKQVRELEVKISIIEDWKPLIEQNTIYVNNKFQEEEAKMDFEHIIMGRENVLEQPEIVSEKVETQE